MSLYVCVCVCVFEVRGYSNPFCCDRGLPEFMLRVPQPKTTHTLKMEVRDQSSDGQVGESERYLMVRKHEPEKELCCGSSTV